MELSYISVQLYTRADSGGETAMLRGSTRGYNGEKYLPAQHKLQCLSLRFEGYDAGSRFSSLSTLTGTRYQLTLTSLTLRELRALQQLNNRVTLSQTRNA